MKHSFYSLMTAMALLAMSPSSSMAQGLKDIYKDYFLIGVAVNQRNVSNAEQAALVKHSSNMNSTASLARTT